MSKRSNKVKTTRTTRYLMDRLVPYATEVISPPSDPTKQPATLRIPRLSLIVTPKLPYDSHHISVFITNHPDKPLYFCDTSFFDERLDSGILSALLSCTGRVVIIPPVLLELQPWFKAHPNHPITQAIQAKHPAFTFPSLEELEAWEVKAVEYYVNLLGRRKTLLSTALANFQLAKGRGPDSSELQEICETVHRVYGPRGYMIAKKGLDTPFGPTFFTDELLVYLAVHTAITSGQSVVLLTKDEDIQEQLYKLQWLLDTHYRGMLLANLYAQEFPRFKTHIMPRSVDFDRVFEVDRGVLLERSEELLRDVLPRTFKTLVAECLVVGETYTRMTWCAEQQMTRLLQVKGHTDGLNTEALDGRNCHIWLAPLRIPEKWHGCAAIVDDRHVAVMASKLPRLDLLQAISAIEQCGPDGTVGLIELRHRDDVPKLHLLRGTPRQLLLRCPRCGRFHRCAFRPRNW